ncbi:MAG: hypothetical protein JW866_05520 [Ignavibacteriales bacterium]|nr:hypothetical protein [Ignavibacteriales bacterium]
MKNFFIILLALAFLFISCDKDKKDTPDNQDTSQDQIQNNDDNQDEYDPHAQYDDDTNIPKNAQFDWIEINAYCSEAGINISSSELNNDDPYQFGPYGVHNLFDNDLTKCWAEGVAGSGIGEYFIFGIEEGITKLRIANGYHKSKQLYENNNRVKRFKATIYVGIENYFKMTELYCFYNCVKYENEFTINLADEMKIHEIMLPIDWDDLIAFREEVIEDYMGDYSDPDRGELTVWFLLKLEIDDIYKGKKHDDTCVSDVWVEY